MYQSGPTLTAKTYFYAYTWMKGQVHASNIILFRMTLSYKHGYNNAWTLVWVKLHDLNINWIAEESIVWGPHLYVKLF